MSLVMGIFTFKEDVHDIRTRKVVADFSQGVNGLSTHAATSHRSTATPMNYR
jgi:hypothetical protein